MDKTNTLREATRELGGVSDEEWLALLPALRTRVLEAGEVWIELGEPAGEFGFMLSGLVRKIFVDAEGRTFTRGFSREGELAGPYASLLAGAPSSLRVVALEPSELVVIPFEAFRRLLAHPGWERCARVVAENALIERDWRESWLLTMKPEARYREVMHAMPWLSERVPQHVVASYLGVTPESLSRLRARGRKTPG